MTERIQSQVRLPTPLHARLTAAAAERMVSVNYLHTRAVEQLLDQLPPLVTLNSDERAPGQLGPSSRVSFSSEDTT